MDNTELHYITYDPDAIWEKMMENYNDAGGDTLYPGDEKEMLLRSVLADIVQAFAGVDNALRMMTLRYAVGEYLDMIGELRSCPRIQAKAARAAVTITTIGNGITGTIPAGTAMTADGEVYYLLAEDFPLTGYQQTATVEVIADRTGIAGNGLQSGTDMELSSKNLSILSIVSASDATGGQEAEADDVYRERIRTHLITSVTTGPARQYEAAAMAVSSVILDAKATGGSGEVDIFLILSDQTGAAALLDAVEEALNAEDVRPLTDTVTVSQATDITYTLTVKYKSDGSSATNAALSEAVAEYQDWQDNKIGRAFDPNRLMAMLYQAGCTRVIWDTGSEFGDGGSIEYTEISIDERCKGTITLTAMT